jgi:chromate transporter
MATLMAWKGWAHDYTQMAWFFTKAALLTFGGAYAVLPYVVQGAVQQYQWLSPQQMVDGLALGETTPGPLIMIVAFVAFVGAASKSLLGPDLAFASGALAAGLVTWFTFLPSFVFIFAGGPFIESTQRKLAFQGPLTAITAAVVGVIVNLGLFFGVHTLWPEGLSGTVQWFAVGLAAGAGVALFVFKRGVIETILVCALIGLGRALLMPAG